MIAKVLRAFTSAANSFSNIVKVCNLYTHEDTKHKVSDFVWRENSKIGAIVYEDAFGFYAF